MPESEMPKIDAYGFIEVIRKAANVALLYSALVGVALAQSGGSAPAIPQRLTLQQAEQLLIERNLAVTAAKYQIDASRAAKLIASFKPNPVLTVGGEQLTFAHPFHTDSNAGAQTTLTLRVDKTIERGHKRELRTEQADYLVKANEAQMLDAIRTQIYQLRQAFNAATLARENLLLAEQTEQQYEQTEKLTATKVENGELPGLEVYRARAGRLQYEQAVLQAHTAYELAARDVLNLLGARVEDVAPASTQTAAIIPASFDRSSDSSSIEKTDAPQFSASLRSAPVELVASFDDRPIAQNLEELRQGALAERPDVLAARYLVESAGRNVSLAQAQRVRDISVGTEYQRVGSDNSVGGTMSIPLFLYNNQRAGIAQAEAQRKASEALLLQAELQATTDVEKAYQSYLSARRTLDLYGSQNLKQIEKLRSIAALSYKEGASSLFELLDAQRTYNAALTSLNQARADYQLALWQLEQAIGKPLR